MARIWVGVLHISPRTAQKIVQLHGVEPDEVRDAVKRVPNLPFTWNNDVQRGWRALVKPTIRRRLALVVLYPIDEGDFDDEWNLGSAYFISGA